MQTIGTLHNYVTRRRSRLVGAGVAAVLGCLLLLVLFLGLFAERPQSGASAIVPIASADVKDLQTQIDRTAQDVAFLRSAVDQMRTDIAALRDPRAEPAAANARAPAGLPAGNPEVAVRPLSFEAPAHPAAPTHPARRSARVRTVVVDGVTYVEGREPHALSLPAQ